MEHIINKCFQCGSDAELHHSGSTEYCGMNSQSVSIMCCEGTGNCCVDLSLTYDTNKDEDFQKVEEILVEAWNKISDLRKGKKGG